MALPENIQWSNHPEPIPESYYWLHQQKLLPMLAEAIRLYGSIEGENSHSTLNSWLSEIGGNADEMFSADSVAWCGLFLSVLAQRCDQTLPQSPLWALNWGTFGNWAQQPMLGDVLVFIRNGGGHACLYIGEDDTAYHTLDGNQTDRVCFLRILKSRMYICRRPNYPISIQQHLHSFRLQNNGLLL